MNIYDAVEKYGLSVFTEKTSEGDSFRCVISKKEAPWEQCLARDHRVILSDTTGRTPDEAFAKAIKEAIERIENEHE